MKLKRILLRKYFERKKASIWQEIVEPIFKIFRFIFFTGSGSSKRRCDGRTWKGWRL